MNKVLIIICLLFCTKSFSQNTYYYKLVKKLQNSKVLLNIDGGQFVAFVGDICYEADKKGIGVGHGTLKLNKSYSNSQFKYYMGSSYWGEAATFKFKSDLSVLNVVLENGDVYVYKRQVAPASATTCSLIRKKGNSSGNSGSYPPSYHNNSYGGGYNTGGSSSSSQRQNTTHSRTQPTKHTCSLCNGQRRIVKDTYPPLYGQSNYQVKCNECGGYFMRSTGHIHITCPQCHGKGYFTTE